MNSRILISLIIRFFIIITCRKKKYLLDSNGRFILDNNHRPLKH
ncbi:hypothetical protein PANI_CDS0095 [Maribacter phage Panino]